MVVSKLIFKNLNFKEVNPLKKKIKNDENSILNYLENTKLFDIDISSLRSKNFYKEMLNNREKYYKKYKKFLNKKLSQNCILCGNKTNKAFLSWKEYILFECDYCGSVFPNINFKSFSKSDFFIDNSTKHDDFMLEMLNTFNYRKKTFGAERYEYLKSKYKRFNKNFSVLDYGCGSGYFIELLKNKKISAKGIDLDNNAVNFCKKRGMDVSNSELGDEKNNQYDLITMFDSIEHFHDPVSVFKTAHKKLREKGRILAYTPNIRSLSTYLMGTEHNALAVFDHVCLYNYKSLKYLANKSKFFIESIDYYGLDIKDYLQMKESKDNINYNKKLNDLSNLLQAFLDKSKQSNHMRIIFRKK